MRKSSPQLTALPLHLLSRLKEWIFYGHVWIALAAAGLSWYSACLALPHYEREWSPVVGTLVRCLFFATLGVYTLHRLLSYRRAKTAPTAKRYRIVRRHPRLSLAIGGCSLLYAASLLVPHLPAVWPLLLISVVLTAFYLTPPLPGWRRLRDLPYVKVIWVALAWTIMTHYLPVSILAGAESAPLRHVDQLVPYAPEYLCRFSFTLAVALLFDLRDVELDRSQHVRTVAGSYPLTLRIAVYLLLALCAALTFLALHKGVAVAYLCCSLIAAFTFRRQDEDWFAIPVNGMLLLPPLWALLLA